MLTDIVSGCFRPRTPHPWHVREVRDLSELRTLEGSWRSLFRATPQASFFQSWDWFQIYWRHFGRDQQLRVLITEDSGGTPTGIVPLSLRRESRRIGILRRLGFPLDNWGTQYGPLGADPGSALVAAFRHLGQRRRDWDVIDLRWVSAQQSPAFAGAWREAGMHFQQRLWNRIAEIELSQGWEAYWNSRTSKWRNNQRRADKQLASLGPVRFVHFRPQPGSTDPRWDLYDLCEQVAHQSWQGSSTSGNTLNHPAVRDFLRDAHVAAVRSGCVHLSLVFVGDQPLAFTYNYVANGATYGLRMGFDARFHTARPGAVLIRETIRECCAQGDRRFDLGESPSPYKRHWANHQLETFRFCHYSASSPLAAVLRIKGWLASALHSS